MRKILFVFFLVLLSVAWAAAQQPGMGSPNSSTPGGRAVGPSSPDNSAGQATPSSPSDQQSTAGMGGQNGKEQIVEGCLGGSAPDFTVTDKAGTVYKMDIPKNADASPLSSHIGESVRVKGMVNGAGASSSAKSQSIQVEQVGRGTGTCAGSSAGSTGTSGSAGTSGSTGASGSTGTGATSGSGAGSSNPSGATPPKTK